MLLPSGLTAEFGITMTAWAAVPLDAGTARVLGDGARAIYDPCHVIGAALETLNKSPQQQDPHGDRGLDTT